MTARPPDRNIVQVLDRPTAALLRLAAAIAGGNPEATSAKCRDLIDAGAPALWADELLLQSVLMVGYPRALSAARCWREARGAEAESMEDGGSLTHAPEWAARGEQLCRTIYGDNYDKLRRNVRALHPALDAWMVADGYGRTLGRPGLDLVRRELCVIAQVAVLGAGPQLHSHLRGAVNAGALPAVVEAGLELALEYAEPGFRTRARALWEQLRP